MNYAEYMTDANAHHDTFYAQFSTADIRADIKRNATPAELSGEERFPLAKCDAIALRFSNYTLLDMQRLGVPLTLSTRVCVVRACLKKMQNESADA